MEDKGEMEKCLFCIPNRLHERLHRLHRRLRQDPVAQVENVRRVPRHALKERACLRPNFRGRSKEDRGLEVALEADSSPEALARLAKRNAPIHAQDARATLGEVREEVRAAIHVKKGWSPFLDGLLKGFFLVGKGKGAEIFRAQELSPGIEELDRGGAGPDLSRQVAAGRFSDSLQEPMHQGRILVKEPPNSVASPLKAALDQVSSHGEGRPGKTKHGSG